MFDSATFLSSTANASGTSERRGIEIAGAWRPLPGLRIDANYTFLDAEDQQVAGDLELRETRRPRHSASIALDWEAGPLLAGASAAYVGERRATAFAGFPAPDLTLGDYVFGSLRLAYRINDEIELFARADNLFDAKYQDVVGYATPGMTVYAGLRLRVGD